MVRQRAKPGALPLSRGTAPARDERERLAGQSRDPEWSARLQPITIVEAFVRRWFVPEQSNGSSAIADRNPNAAGLSNIGSSVP
jgi:hypothetical protein